MTLRCRVVAFWMLLPTLLTAAGLSAVEAWRLREPESPLVSSAFAYSLAEAIERDDVQRAYAFIRAGHGPDALMVVRHPTLTEQRWVQVSPLLWAVALQSERSVMMLLGHGARMERPADKMAACLAEQLGNEALAAALRQYGTAPSEPCPRQSRTTAPLLSLLGEPD